MPANLLVINARKRQNPLAPADPTDFDFSEGSAIDPQTIVSDIPSVKGSRSPSHPKDMRFWGNRRAAGS